MTNTLNDKSFYLTDSLLYKNKEYFIIILFYDVLLEVGPVSF